MDKMDTEWRCDQSPPYSARWNEMIPASSITARRTNHHGLAKQSTAIRALTEQDPSGYAGQRAAVEFALSSRRLTPTQAGESGEDDRAKRKAKPPNGWRGHRLRGNSAGAHRVMVAALGGRGSALGNLRVKALQIASAPRSRHRITRPAPNGWRNGSTRPKMPFLLLLRGYRRERIAGGTMSICSQRIREGRRNAGRRGLDVWPQSPNRLLTADCRVKCQASALWFRRDSCLLPLLVEPL